MNADAGISLWDSPGTRVYHNTVIQNGTYPAAIEYRFPGTTGVEIINNLTDGLILQRDSAQGVVHTNYTQATADFFVNAAAADLHLSPTATLAIDRGANVSAVTADWDGDPRPAGAAPDLGADERRTASGNQPPSAVMTATPTTGPAPLIVTFDGRGSIDPENGSLTHSWVFGDGQSGAGSTIVHSYAAPGSYTATLRVVDSGGAEAFHSMTIIVSDAPRLSTPPGDARVPHPAAGRADESPGRRVISASAAEVWTDNAEQRNRVSRRACA